VGSWAARRTARLFIQLTPKERAELEALATRDGRTLTATVVGLVTRAHAMGVAEGTLAAVSPPPWPPPGEIDHQLRTTAAALRSVSRSKNKAGRR